MMDGTALMTVHPELVEGLPSFDKLSSNGVGG
jgi:hypothetical protein